MLNYIKCTITLWKLDATGWARLRLTAYPVLSQVHKYIVDGNNYYPIMYMYTDEPDLSD